MEQTPDLNAMVLFARVLQHGSFSEAARRTGTPVSTLSRKVSALERQLGVRLLERTTRAVNPTDSGREYFLYCEQIVDALDGAQAALKKRQVEVTGTLRLAAPPSLSDVLLIPLVDGFLRRYSNVAVKVLVTDRHLDLVQDEVDISLRVGPQPASSLVFRRLLSYRHILVAAPAYLAGAEALDEPADLTRHRLLGFTKWFDETDLDAVERQSHRTRAGETLVGHQRLRGRDPRGRRRNGSRRDPVHRVPTGAVTRPSGARAGGLAFRGGGSVRVLSLQASPFSNRGAVSRALRRACREGLTLYGFACRATTSSIKKREVRAR